MDYTKFSVEDLATDDSFIRWVYGSDQEAINYWNLFITVHPEMKIKIEHAKTLILNVRRAEAKPQNEKQLAAIWESIEYRITDAEKETSTADRITMKTTWYGIAAAISLILIVAGVWYNTQQANTKTDQNFDFVPRSVARDFIEEVNTTNNVLRIHLNDGSVVDLESGSRLKYKKSYKDESLREVYLLGDAFFVVTKNSKQPFLVHANDVVTKVIGTSFRVTSREHGKNVVVSVKTGKVSVYSEKNLNSSTSGEPSVESEKNGVILLPNQQVTYQREQESFDKTLVDIPEVLISTVTTRDFTFENTPMTEVFKLLEKAYGVEILFDEETMQKCYITAPLGSEPLFEKLKIICRTIGANYEVIDAKVIINSPGC